MGSEITKTGVILGSEGLNVKDLRGLEKCDGATYRNRTCDQLFTKQLLYRLS